MNGRAYMLSRRMEIANGHKETLKPLLQLAMLETCEPVWTTTRSWKISSGLRRRYYVAVSFDIFYERAPSGSLTPSTMVSTLSFQQWNPVFPRCHCGT